EYRASRRKTSTRFPLERFASSWLERGACCFEQHNRSVARQDATRSRALPCGQQSASASLASQKSRALERAIMLEVLEDFRVKARERCQQSPIRCGRAGPYRASRGSPRVQQRAELEPGCAGFE